MIKSIFHQLILIVFILSIFSSNSFSQFSVLSTSPINGTVNVDTATTLTITFSAAVDTNARFTYPGNIFIELFFTPDSLVDEPDSITFSVDMHTVYLHNLHLSEFTDYRFCILNAVSITGDSLDSPFTFSFTTNPAMSHNATVSGIIGPNPHGAMVFLFDSNPFEEDENYWGYWAVATPATGSYTVDFVAPDFYWPVVIRNYYLDEDGDIEIQDGSELGYLDFNGDLRPDSIFVFSGSNLTGVDMTMDDVYLQTARNSFDDINLIAQGWVFDATLVRFGGDELFPDGTSMFWQYLYHSQSLDNYKQWFLAGDMIVTIKGDELFEADTTALPPNWLDSDSIMAVAEANGGTEFRQQFYDVTVEGGCNHLYPDWFGKKQINVMNSKQPESIVKSVVWSIEYESNTSWDSLELYIDAINGTYLDPLVTAGAAEEKAAVRAENWAADAKLWRITNQAGSVDSAGNADLWYYNYYSAQKDSMRGIYYWGLLPIWDGTLAGISFDTSTIHQGWINSDMAMQYAELLGGSDYRQNNQQIYIEAALGQWINGTVPDSIIWQIIYNSNTANPLEIILDAYEPAGAINSDNRFVPDNFILNQNYPNPFNPQTTFEFYLPTASKVKLVIYNIVGQIVSTIENKYMPAGNHQIKWKVDNLPSGVYFYKVLAGEYSAIKKCILLK